MTITFKNYWYRDDIIYLLDLWKTQHNIGRISYQGFDLTNGLYVELPKEDDYMIFALTWDKFVDENESVSMSLARSYQIC